MNLSKDLCLQQNILLKSLQLKHMDNYAIYKLPRKLFLKPRSIDCLGFLFRLVVVIQYTFVNGD